MNSRRMLMPAPDHDRPQMLPIVGFMKQGDKNIPYLLIPNLRKICAKTENTPVVLLSAVGKFRGGKSLLLKLLRRGLIKRSDLLSPETLIGGDISIPFSGGDKAHTEGIQMWSELIPFMTKDGREVNLLIVDSQGTFDAQTDRSVSHFIFCIIYLLSSFMISNVTRSVGGDDLDHTECFLGITRAVQQAMGGEDKDAGKLLKNFVWMIRDYPGNEQGEHGHSPEYLKTCQIQTTQSDEKKNALSNIGSACDSLDVFTLPYPPGHFVGVGANSGKGIRLGELVRQDRGGGKDIRNVKSLTSRSINQVELTTPSDSLDAAMHGELEGQYEFSEDTGYFMRKVVEFLDFVETEASVKQWMGTELTGARLFDALNKIVTHSANGGIADIKSSLEVMVNNSVEMAKREGMYEYKVKRQQAFQDSGKDINVFCAIILQAFKEGKKAYEKVTVYGASAAKDDHFKQFCNELREEMRKDRKDKRRNIVTAYVEDILAQHYKAKMDRLPPGTTLNEMEQHHIQNLQNCQNLFDEKIAVLFHGTAGEDSVDPERELVEAKKLALVENIMVQYLERKKDRRAINFLQALPKASKDAAEVYKREMEKAIENSTTLKKLIFEVEFALSRAKDEFNKHIREIEKDVGTEFDIKNMVDNHTTVHFLPMLKMEHQLAAIALRRRHEGMRKQKAEQAAPAS